MRAKVVAEDIYGLIHISEGWAYFPKSRSDHTLKQLAWGEMKVSDLNEHDKKEVLVVAMLSRDGENINENRNEWGYEWENLDDGTMGQPHAPVLPAWKDFKTFKIPSLKPEERIKGIKDFQAEAEDRYQLASLGITGFTLYTFLRGFENSMMDFVMERDLAGSLIDHIMSFECDIFRLASKWNFDGVILGDDWGTQEGLIISPTLWREIFRHRYENQAKLAHELGLHLWFHCCGNISEIIKDMHEIGVDVINISQPNVVDIEHVGSIWRGKQCFMVPISYQTVSITGTTEDIHAEAKRLVKHLGTPTGGFIGYVEDYSCMGMSEENYQACASAFT